MFSSLLLDSNDSVTADRLSRLQDSLRALQLSTREGYQAAVYSMVNAVLNLGDEMQTLENVRPRPAIVGDLTTNLTRLNQDSTDIAAEMLRIESNAGDLYNLAAASQNALRQLIRQAIYCSNKKQCMLPFIDDSTLQSGYTASIDFNAGVATLPLSKQTQVAPTITVGLGSVGKALTDISVLASPAIGSSFEWSGSTLELILSFPAATTVNRLIFDLDTYDGLEITTLTSSPDGLVFNDVLADLDVPAIVMDATSGKCSGDVVLDFPPRLVQQMRIVIEGRAGQTSFGLRSLSAFNRSYQSNGTLTTNPIYLSSTEVQFSTDELVSSPFSSVTHQISTDGVNFISVDPGVVTVTKPFWYRAVLSRSDSAFSQKSSPLLPIAATANAPYTVKSQTTQSLNNGIVEQTIVLSNVTGPVTFQNAPLPGSFQVQVGSIYLNKGTDYSLNGSTLTLTANQSLVTITFQTSALGAAALASLKNFYSPLLYKVSFKAI